MKLNIKNIKYFIFAAFFCLSGISAFSAPFNSNLSEQEKLLVESGETVIKNTPSYKKMCLDSDVAVAKRLIERVNSLKPAYFAEVIKEIPVEGNEDFLERLESLTLDIESYVGIPYYSERNKKWYDLYSAAEIKSAEKNQNSTKITADLTMEPFGLIKTQINSQLDLDNNCFYYEMVNLSKLKYENKIDCVSTENMKSILIAFKDGDKWVMYSCGAVKAPNVFFLKDRIELSFMNRIKTFCSYFFEKLI